MMLAPLSYYSVTLRITNLLYVSNSMEDWMHHFLTARKLYESRIRINFASCNKLIYFEKLKQNLFYAVKLIRIINVTQMKINHVIRIGSLYANSERIGRVKYESG